MLDKTRRIRILWHYITLEHLVMDSISCMVLFRIQVVQSLNKLQHWGNIITSLLCLYTVYIMLLYYWTDPLSDHCTAVIYLKTIGLAVKHVELFLFLLGGRSSMGVWILIKSRREGSKVFKPVQINYCNLKNPTLPAIPHFGFFWFYWVFIGNFRDLKKKKEAFT